MRDGIGKPVFHTAPRARGCDLDPVCELPYRPAATQRSQQRPYRCQRAISRVQKLRMRLGGSANLLEPFPARPRGMHRMTYYRLLDRAMTAQGARSLWSSNICISTIPVFEAKRASPWVDFRHRRMQRAGLAGRWQVPRAAGARGRATTRRRWAPRGAGFSIGPMIGPKAPAGGPLIGAVGWAHGCPVASSCGRRPMP